MRYIIFICAAALLLGGCATSGALAAGPELALMGSDSDDLDLGTAPTGPIPTAIGSPDSMPVEIIVSDEESPAPPPPPAPDEATPPSIVVEDGVIEDEVVIEVAPEAYAGPTLVRNAPGGPCGCKQAAGACCDCCDPTWPCWYLEVRTELLPGIGMGVNYGRRFGQMLGGTLYGELGVSFQDMWEPFTGEEEAGDWWQVRAGFRLERACDYCARFQPYLRGGLALMVLNGDLDDIKQSTFNFDEDGSYFGGYVAVGLNLSLGRKLRMGPEIGLSGGWGQGDFGWTPQFSWNLDIDF